MPGFDHFPMDHSSPLRTAGPYLRTENDGNHLTVGSYRPRVSTRQLSPIRGDCVTPPVRIIGNAFWQGDTRFFVRGVIYDRAATSQRGNYTTDGRSPDPLALENVDELSRDIQLMRELGINTVYLQNVDGQQDHSTAMSLLRNAGIYVVVNLSSTSANVDLAKAPRSYNRQLLSIYLGIVKSFAGYDNLLGITVSPGVFFRKEHTLAAPEFRAIIRDVKKYVEIRARLLGDRLIPVGIGVSDWKLVRKESVKYFSAGQLTDRADFIGLTAWSWAGHSNVKVSGWEAMTNALEIIQIPLILSDYGANANRPRYFEETTALFSSMMSAVFSGGCINELFDRPGSDPLSANGLVRCDVDGKISRKKHFWALKERLDQLNDEASSNIHGGHQNYWREDGWLGSFPDITKFWFATPATPSSIVDWNEVRTRIQSRADGEMVFSDTTQPHQEQPRHTIPRVDSGYLEAHQVPIFTTTKANAQNFVHAMGTSRASRQVPIQVDPRPTVPKLLKHPLSVLSAAKPLEHASTHHQESPRSVVETLDIVRPSRDTSHSRASSLSAEEAKSFVFDFDSSVAGPVVLPANRSLRHIQTRLESESTRKGRWDDAPTHLQPRDLTMDIPERGYVDHDPLGCLGKLPQISTGIQAEPSLKAKIDNWEDAVERLDLDANYSEHAVAAGL